MKGEGEEEQEVNIVYKTKVVQFLGRQVPIILQNDNGPCPLLAICNVLLLRNNLNVSTDLAEISLSELLSLIAERLLDVNSNTEVRDMTLCLSYPKYIMVSHTCCVATAYSDVYIVFAVQMNFLSFCAWYIYDFYSHN
jgi:hypothetical protein